VAGVVRRVFYIVTAGGGSQVASLALVVRKAEGRRCLMMLMEGDLRSVRSSTLNKWRT
jgi:hypothetical protein